MTRARVLVRYPDCALPVRFDLELHETYGSPIEVSAYLELAVQAELLALLDSTGFLWVWPTELVTWVTTANIGKAAGTR